MNKKKISFFPGVTAIIAGIGTAVIGAIMNIILIPQIEANTGGIRCFDMNPGYNYEQASEFLRLIGDEGRHIYLGYQLPMDFIYPVFYTLLFVSLIVLLTKKKSPLLVLPLLLAVSDYGENILSEIMLRADSLSRPLVTAASALTLIKTLLMYVTILAVVILIVIAAVKKAKNGKTQNQ